MSLPFSDALALVELAQLVGRLEGAVLVHGLRPRDVRRAGDVAAALGALLLVAGHRDQLARVLLRRATSTSLVSVPTSFSISSRTARIVVVRPFASNCAAG